MPSLQAGSGRNKRRLRSDPECPDLAALCAGRWRTSADPAHQSGDAPDPFLVTLEGRRGTVYPFGPGRLAVEVHDGRIALALAAFLGGALPYQRGHRFFCYLSRPDQLGVVAAVIQPPKVRHLSARARERLAAAGEGTQFGALCHGTPTVS
jgi:hypothetical protein